MEHDRLFYLKKMQIAAKSLLENGRSVNIQVVTGSMKPTIMPEQFVKTIPKEKCRIKAGDIILMSQFYEGSLIIHRCLLVIRWNEKKYYITKGDACLIIDRIVPENRVLGKVELIEPVLLRLWFQYGQYLILPFSFAYRFLYGIWQKYGLKIYKACCRLKFRREKNNAA